MRADVPIAQWIERCPPEAEAQVRVLVGTLEVAAKFGAAFLFPWPEKKHLHDQTTTSPTHPNNQNLAKNV